MVLFHKYTLGKKNFLGEKEMDIVCIAAVFIATKICNQLISLTRLIPAFLSMKGLLKDSEYAKMLPDSVMQTEFEILCVVGFDLNVDLPYIYIEQMKPYFEEYIKKEKLLKIVYNFVNDSFKLPLILFYSPLKIALSAIYLSLNCHLKVDLVDTKENIKWYHIINKDIDLAEIIEISNLNSIIYAISKEAKMQYLTTSNKPKEYLNKNFDFLNRKHSTNLHKECNFSLKNENSNRLSVETLETQEDSELRLKENTFA